MLRNTGFSCRDLDIVRRTLLTRKQVPVTWLSTATDLFNHSLGQGVPPLAQAVVPVQAILAWLETFPQRKPRVDFLLAQLVGRSVLSPRTLLSKLDMIVLVMPSVALFACYQTRLILSRPSVSLVALSTANASRICRTTFTVEWSPSFRVVGCG